MDKEINNEISAETNNSFSDIIGNIEVHNHTHIHPDGINRKNKNKNKNK